MRPTLLLLTLLLALPGAARGDDSLMLFPAIGRPTLVTVTGRALRSTPEDHRRPLEKNLRRLAARGREDAAVTVSFAGQVRRVTSGDEGLFEASFAAPAQAPFPTGLQPVRAAAGAVSAEGRVDVVSDAAPFLVVSDFDDTVAVTGVQSKRALLSAALLADETTQPVVAGMAAFYRCLRERSEAAPGFAVVSGSPIEYAPRLQSFLDRGGFPFAALHLRQLGPGTLSGYKEPALRALLSRFPQAVVLVGDSGEADPEVYARIREEFPGRVRAIFIRDVGRSEPTRFAGMVLFGTAAQAAREAAARGLLSKECLQRELPAP